MTRDRRSLSMLASSRCRIASSHRCLITGWSAESMKNNQKICEGSMAVLDDIVVPFNDSS
jgi:hypothetical protein